MEETGWGTFGQMFGQGLIPLNGGQNWNGSAVKVVVPRKRSEDEIRVEIEKTFNQYQIVHKEYMAGRFDPAMTVKDKMVTFNNSCITKLETAVYVQFMINPELRTMIIRPCEEKDDDAIRWCSVKGDKRKSRTISCRDFTDKLFEYLAWDKTKRYRIQGRLIPVFNENVYYFDLKERQQFDIKSKKGAAAPEYPENWQGFGYTVEEHSQKAEIDLADYKGFPEGGETGEEMKNDANDALA